MGESLFEAIVIIVLGLLVLDNKKALYQTRNRICQKCTHQHWLSCDYARQVGCWLVGGFGFGLVGRSLDGWLWCGSSMAAGVELMTMAVSFGCWFGVVGSNSIFVTSTVL